MKPPVFVLGAPRSGTTLLYHMLLSSGKFATYMSETHVFNLVGPRFGDLAIPDNRRKLLEAWLQSFQFRRSGLDAASFSAAIMEHCTSTGEFLRIFMEQISHRQGVERWAECTPEHLLYLKEIKRELPGVKVIHIIRDGRDVALSELRQGWVQPLPWDRTHRLAVSGLYWEWIVRKGREDGRRMASDYMEVRFEELIETPQAVLDKISEFIGESLIYEELLKNGVGTLKTPNTSFAEDEEGKSFNPVGRWKQELPDPELRLLESTIQPFLSELRYQLAFQNGGSHAAEVSLTARRLRLLYPSYFEAKLWLKTRTPLGRRAGTAVLDLHAKN